MLNIDSFFYSALKDSEVYTSVDGRIYNPARTDEEENADLIPYIIISTMGESSTYGSKDDIFSELDTATVQVLVVAKDREALAELTEATHAAIKEAVEDAPADSTIANITPSAGSVQLDPFKPCCFQDITYTVECL